VGLICTVLGNEVFNVFPILSTKALLDLVFQLSKRDIKIGSAGLLQFLMNFICLLDQFECLVINPWWVPSRPKLFPWYEFFYPYLEALF
jgi:hypothetical protein